MPAGRPKGSKSKTHEGYKQRTAEIKQRFGDDIFKEWGKWGWQKQQDPLFAKSSKQSLAYIDTGCPDGKYPSCLKCPLERCRFENDSEHPSILSLPDDITGKHIAYIRKEYGLSLRDLASQMDVSYQTIFNLEHGYAKMRPTYQERLRNIIQRLSLVS